MAGCTLDLCGDSNFFWKVYAGTYTVETDREYTMDVPSSGVHMQWCQGFDQE